MTEGTAGGGGRPVVVGLDNGGTSNNATVLDVAGHFLVDRLVEMPEPGHRRARSRGRGAGRGRSTACSTPPGAPGGRARRRARHARPGQRRRRDLVARVDQLRRAAWRGFDVRGALEDALGPPGRLQQRRQRRRALRPLRALRRPGAEPSSVSAIVGTGLGGGVVEHGRVVQRRGGHGRRARPRAHPDGRPARRRASRSRSCNCGFAGDVESVASLTGIEQEPPAVLAHPLPGPRAAALGDPVGTAAKLVRGLRRAGRPAGAAGLRAAGDGDRAAVHDRGQLHRPGRLLRRRRRRRGGAALPRVVPRHGRATHVAARRAGAGGRRSRWCPTSTWPAPGARRSRRWSTRGRAGRDAAVRRRAA